MDISRIRCTAIPRPLAMNCLEFNIVIVCKPGISNLRWYGVDHSDKYFNPVAWQEEKKWNPKHLQRKN